MDKIYLKPDEVKLLKMDEFEDMVVRIGRTAKVVKGGRRFSFSALVAVGNKKGVVGIGLGKAKEVPDAIRKGLQRARKNLIRVELKEDRTLWHQIMGGHGAAKVLLKPAVPGTGVIAGGAARAVLELAGFKDVYAKSIGSSNPHNLIRATIDGLMKIASPTTIAARRGKKVEEILG